MSDSESDNGHAPNQALPVANLPFSFNGVPQDGLEYLFTVRRDSRLLPRYTRVPNPFVLTADLSELAPTQATAHKLFPTDEWKESFVEKFRNYRQNLRGAISPAKQRLGTSVKEQEEVPNLQQKAWWEYISGIEAAHANEPSGEGEASKTVDGVEGSVLENSESINSTQGGHEPGLSILGRMTTRQIVQVLYWHSVWVDAEVEALTTKDTTSVIPAKRLTAIHQRWMFCLLGKLDDNLVGEDISTLRILARACIRLIVTRLQAHPQSSSTGSMQEHTRIRSTGLEIEELKPEVPEDSGSGGYWMVIAAIVGVWGQFDIWEEAKQKMSLV